MKQPVRHLQAKRWRWALIDVACWVVAVYVATWLRLDFGVTLSVKPGTATVALGMAGLHVLVGAFAGPYAVGHRRGSFDEIVDLSRTTLLSTLIAFSVLAMAIHPIPVPRTVPLIAGAIALGLMFSARLLVRTYRFGAPTTEGQRRVVIFGAGEGGCQLLTAMLRAPSAGFIPVAVLDDDPHKARLRIEGVRVRGPRAALADVAARTTADTLAIAVPTADAALIRDLRERAVAAGLEVLILPPISEILGGRLSTNDLRDIDLDDLLGRRPVNLDTRVISAQIAGEVVLVTGAGGSIGSELCRQIARFGPRRLYLLDRDESGLQATKLSLTGSGLLDTDDIVLADIRDADAMQDVFRRIRPGIVFHAAALKHLPLLEAYPLEAWKSNVLGTLNVLTAASAVGVATFINISTDKAADPTCVLGYSKRLAERVTADFAVNQTGRYVSVRFGNVLGSRGSVVHAFTAQIDRGGPVTVTDPCVERYFMLIPEACQLVLEAASIGADGDVLVLDMGTPVKILEVANTLIRMSGRHDVEVVFTGLRPGEKMGEAIFSRVEAPETTGHTLVSRVDVPPLDSATLTSQCFRDHDSSAAWMRSVSRGEALQDAAAVSIGHR